VPHRIEIRQADSPARRRSSSARRTPPPIGPAWGQTWPVWPVGRRDLRR